MRIRFLSALVVAAPALVWSCFHVRSAFAETVRGRVVLSDTFQNPRRFPGYWRVENGTVPITPPTNADPPVVLLTGLKGEPSTAKTYTVDIQGFAASKPTLVVSVGSVVEIRNGDKVAHDLSIPGQETLMPLQRLGPGGLRRQKFVVPGAYEIGSAQYPHLTIAVLVVDNAFASACDAKGNFKIGDVPVGKASLKVWAQGQFVHEQSLDVQTDMKALQIDVATATSGDSE